MVGLLACSIVCTTQISRTYDEGRTARTRRGVGKDKHAEATKKKDKKYLSDRTAQRQTKHEHKKTKPNLEEHAGARTVYSGRRAVGVGWVGAQRNKQATWCGRCAATRARGVLCCGTAAARGT